MGAEGVHRPAWAEISTAALARNVAALKALLGESALCAVVKANGYGHGALIAASALLGAGADSVAVALVDEGIELREAGFTQPVLVLAEVPASSIPDALAHDLTLTAGSPAGARSLALAAERAGGRHAVHVKVDTGMRRMGASPEDVDEVVDVLAASPAIDVEGVYTHFSVADGASGEDRAFTRSQIDLFDATLARLRARRGPARRAPRQQRGRPGLPRGPSLDGARRPGALRLPAERVDRRGARAPGPGPRARAQPARPGGRGAPSARRGPAELRALARPRGRRDHRDRPLRVRRRVPAAALRGRGRGPHRRPALPPRRHRHDGPTPHRLRRRRGAPRRGRRPARAPGRRGDHRRGVGAPGRDHHVGDPLRRGRAGPARRRGRLMALDLAQLPTCTRCGLAATRQRVVVGTGPLDPVIMIVGEAPGRTEDEGGEPFIGRSGNLFFRLLAEEVGLVRDQCFVTNTVKCRPPENRTPSPEELAACRPWLRAQLQAVQPRAVLTLGAVAAREVLGLSAPMGAVHGTLVTIGGGPGLATYHPAAVLRTPRLAQVVRADLRVLRRLLESA
ncbi:MAG: alanine racemase [Acidobacteriota bacterium]|nr:alanine racemase [Acidobacteriota bacterium]